VGQFESGEYWEAGRSYLNAAMIARGNLGVETEGVGMGRLQGREWLAPSGMGRVIPVVHAPPVIAMAARATVDYRLGRPGPPVVVDVEIPG